MSDAPVVDDPDDPRITMYLGLRDHVARQVRERPGGDMAACFMAEGDVVIERALAAGHVLVSVLVDAGRTAPLPAGIDRGVVLRGSPAVLTEVCGRPRLRDPIAAFRRPALPPIGGVLDASATVAVLEGVVNPTNVGTIVRCAAALGIDAVLVDPTSCDPLYRRAIRVSMGAAFAIPHCRLDALPGGLGPLEERGYRTLALSPHPDAVSIDEVRRAPDERLAILLGAEGSGLTAVTLERATSRVRIPMSRGVDSLNVGAAAAIAFHTLRPRP